MASASQDSHKELFLDILTKEEKEALLNKKMEDIRKRNEALQKRHAEIEADKKRAEKSGSAVPAQLVQRDSPVLHRAVSQPEDKRSRQQVQQQLQLQLQPVQIQQVQQQSRPATRSKPLPQAHAAGVNRGPKDRPKSQDIRSDASYEYEPIVDIADLDSRHSKGSQSPSKSRRNPPRERDSVLSNLGEASRRRGQSRNNNSYEQPQHNDMQDLPHEPRQGYAIVSQTFSSRMHGRGRLAMEDGPPPDPGYNFLADRSRDTDAAKREAIRQKEVLRQRHPRNFGGGDFNNVKTQIKMDKQKEKDRRSFPPKNKLEMTMIMTGSERFQYEEWKAERMRVDKERLERQKTASGEWRRDWDAEKNFADFEDLTSSSRTEPAKRPAGRIGSGRFDRGDREDRRAENQLTKVPISIQTTVEAERKPPAGRGRGRGRARGRGQGGMTGAGERPPRPRTWSGGDDSRIVECTNDMLLVKIDKSRGIDDHSVEVEYSEDVPVDNTRKSSSPTKGKVPARKDSPVKQRAQSHHAHPQPKREQFQDADVAPMESPPAPPAVGDTVVMSAPQAVPATVLSQDSSMDGRPSSLSQSLSHGDTDEWEDVTGTDSDMYGTTEDEGDSAIKNKSCDQSRQECKLNPEAPVFLPTSPDLTSPAHVNVYNWTKETKTPVTPSSPDLQQLSDSPEKSSPDAVDLAPKVQMDENLELSPVAENEKDQHLHISLEKEVTVLEDTVNGQNESEDTPCADGSEEGAYPEEYLENGSGLDEALESYSAEGCEETSLNGEEMNEDNAEDNALEPDDVAEEASYQQTGQSLADELSSFGKDSEATESETEGETPNIGKDNEATESETEGETPNIGKDNEATESEMEGETPNAGKDNETAESGLEGETIVSKAIESNGSRENFWGKVDTDDAPGSCSTAPEQCDITPSKDEEQMAAAVEDKSSIEPVLEASTLSSTQSSLDQQSGATEQMSPSVLEPDGCISSENVVLAPLSAADL